MPARNPSVPVLIVCDGEAALCRSMQCGPMEYGGDVELILSWSRAIRVTPAKLLLQTLIPLSATKFFTFTNFDGRADHCWAKVLPIRSWNMGASQNCATFLSCPVTLPMSIVLRRNDMESLEISPLQLASLKRQLVGTYILHYEDRFATNLNLALDGVMFVFHVEDVNFHENNTCVNHAHLFLLSPSTRITILGFEPQTSPVNPSLIDVGNSWPSDGVRLLRDTITVMKEYKAIDIPRTFLLSGPPGVGKTHAVEKTAKYLKTNVHSTFVSGSAIVSSTSKGSLSTSLEIVFAKVKKRSLRSISLLFMDECDALLSSASVAAMLAFQLDDISRRWPQVIVVAATNRVDSVPQGLRHGGKFEHELIMRPPSLSQRKEILDFLLDKAETNTEELAESTIGFVPADLHAMVRRARIACMNNDERSILKNLRDSIAETGASALRDSYLSKPPVATWDSIAGDVGGAKTALIQAIEWPRTKKEAFRQLGLVPPRGILLHGPPGCAKTSLARAAAGSESIAFISLSPADVFSAFVGEAEAIVRKAFITARSAAPCILFFDEIDAIMGSIHCDAKMHGMHRSGGGSSAESRVLSTFLNETDGLTSCDGDKVLVIGATNRPSALDAALLRPGRFDKVVYVPPPDYFGRSTILQNLMDERALLQVLVKVDCDHLASTEITGNMTGAEIVGAFQEVLTHRVAASLSSGTPLLMDQDDIERGLRAIKPLLGDPHLLHQYEIFQKERKQLK